MQTGKNVYLHRFLWMLVFSSIHCDLQQMHFLMMINCLWFSAFKSALTLSRLNMKRVITVCFCRMVINACFNS